MSDVTPEMRSHEEFRNGGFVSVWLGNISDEDDLDDYLADDFPDDFGFEIDPEDGPEYDVAEPAAPVLELLEGFSCYEDFWQEATNAAKSAGWEKASCALVFYNFAYEGGEVSNDSPLSFIGTFPFSGEEENDEDAE
jgi:Immunity protein 22